MPVSEKLEEILKKYRQGFAPVVPFDKGNDKLIVLDLTEENKSLAGVSLTDTDAFSAAINRLVETGNAAYGIGGYNEHRTLYSRSAVFNAANGEEPRRLHLGTDIWGAAGTPVYAPLEATIHSFAFNDAFGDYGATLILQHDLEGIIFHTLYGHLSLASIQNIKEGQDVEKGQWIAAFGVPQENGHWPPHLHFQIIMDMQNYEGDYPGVCAFSQKAKFLANCPDPDYILGMMDY